MAQKYVLLVLEPLSHFYFEQFTTAPRFLFIKLFVIHTCLSLTRFPNFRFYPSTYIFKNLCKSEALTQKRKE